LDGFCGGDWNAILSNCGVPSSSKHSNHFGQLQDLPSQGVSVMLKLQVAHAIAGGKCRDVEAGVREFHRHEAAGDAVPRRPSIQQFSRTLSRDLDAVRNAVTEKWSNGQAEGQINRLKTLKRAMYV